MQAMSDMSLVYLTLTMHPVLFEWILVDKHVAVTPRDNGILEMYVRIFGWLAVSLGLCRLQASIREPDTIGLAVAATSQLVEMVWFAIEVTSGSYDMDKPCGGGWLEPCPRRVVSSILAITSFMMLWCVAVALSLHMSPKRKPHSQ